jgi:uncharacterized protein (TIGR03435 family)
MVVLRLFAAVLAVGFALSAASQDKTPEHPNANAKAAYEVVSIKPSEFSTSGGTQELPDGFRYTNMSLETLVDGAYDMANGDHVLGMPSWAKSDRYDVEAKVDSGTAETWKKLSNDERWKQEQPMQQAMLADRCKLKAHFETREMRAYDLVIAKGGLKITEATPNEKPTGRMRDGDITLRAMSIENLIAAIPKDGRLIVDKTGLGDKKVDLDLKWEPENTPSDTDSGPSLFTALEEQLGLKLVSSKAFGKVLVIDHIEKPTPN